MLGALRRRADTRRPARARATRADSEEHEAEEREQDEQDGHAEILRLQHSLEQREGAGLVERLVQVPALRALHAGGTTVLARAAVQQLGRVRDPALERIEAALGDADAARVAVVDKDRRRAGLEMQIRREAADVPAVA